MPDSESGTGLGIIKNQALTQGAPNHSYSIHLLTVETVLPWTSSIDDLSVRCLTFQRCSIGLRSKLCGWVPSPCVSWRQTSSGLWPSAQFRMAPVDFHVDKKWGKEVVNSLFSVCRHYAVFMEQPIVFVFAPDIYRTGFKPGTLCILLWSKPFGQQWPTSDVSIMASNITH